jgi:FecR protein
MKNDSRSTMVGLLALTLIVTAAMAQTAAPEQTSTINGMQPLLTSQARIVRLSDVKGEVRIDRNTGQVEKAILNLPITQGTRIGTTPGSFAEVEFEDGSTLDITPGTEVDFSQLGLGGSGGKVSTLNVPQGIAYVNFLGTKDDQFTLSFGQEKLVLTPSSHIRLAVGPGKAALAVLGGNVQVEGLDGTISVGKKKSLTFDLSSQNPPVLSKKVAEGPYDTWEAQQLDYHKHYAKASAYGSPSYAYGISDMNYYGNFSNVAGCGTLWRPYFASAGWDPFLSGTWAWYPGAGYSWVSPYPWGWLPFHSGAWQFCPDVGWGWRPGSTWRGIHNPPKPIKPPQGFPPPRPPKPPTPGHPMLTAVNRAPLAASSLTAAGRFTVPSDSAGLGVPRDAISNPRKVSQQVQQHGSADVKVYTAPSPAGPIYGRAAENAERSSSTQGFGGRGGARGSSYSGGGGHSISGGFHGGGGGGGSAGSGSHSK